MIKRIYKTFQTPTEKIYKETLLELFMENSLKKIFQSKTDEIVRGEFIKFSKGNFRNRYLLEAKKQKNRWAIKAGPEFANYLVRACLEKTPGEIDVVGVIVATFDVSKKADFPVERIKKFM